MWGRGRLLARTCRLLGGREEEEEDGGWRGRGCGSGEGCWLSLARYREGARRRLEGRGVGAGELPCLQTAPRWQGKVPRGRMHRKLPCRRGAWHACFVRVRVLEAGGRERKAARSIMHACMFRACTCAGGCRSRAYACLVLVRVLEAAGREGNAWRSLHARACACVCVSTMTREV